MLIFKHTEPNLLESSSIALGVFDGVHLGHIKVIKNAISLAQKHNTSSCIVTFSNHPQELLGVQNVQIITPIEQKLELFKELGVETVLLLEFSKKLMSLSAEQYLKNILIDGLNPKAITTGFNHHFGANKKGDTHFIQNHAGTFGYEVAITPPVKVGSDTVSSSLIRHCITEGQIQKANTLLGRDFSISSKVERGTGQGISLGFPTVNITKYPIDIANGVYAGWVKYNGNKHKAAINIGSAPTIKNGKKTIEAHILHFSKDIYEKDVEVGFIKKLRDERKFESRDKLIVQIQKDIESI